MPEIRVDSNLCQKDGLCTLACPVGIFEQKKRDAAPAVVSEEMCIGCGHCVAVCPHEAISHSDYPEGTSTPVAAEEADRTQLGLLMSGHGEFEQPRGRHSHAA